MADQMQGHPEPAIAEQLVRARQLWRAGQYDAAQDILERLWTANPDSAQIAAAYGDFWAHRGRWQEASEWYETALSIEPSGSVRRRLEHARRMASGEGAGPTRAHFIAAAVASGVVLVAAIAALVALSRPSRQAPPASSAPPPPVRVGQTAGRFPVAARRGGQASSAAPTATFQGAAAPSAGPPAPGQQAPGPSQRIAGQQPPVVQPTVVHVTKRIEAPATETDLYLTRALDNLRWPDGTSMGKGAIVQFDPFTGYAFVTVTAPPALGKANLYREVLRAGYAVARALVRAYGGVKYITVRVLWRKVEPTRRQRLIVAWRGNTSREAIEWWEENRPNPTVGEIWSQVFATCWWNPEVPRGQGGPPGK